MLRICILLFINICGVCLAADQTLNGSMGGLVKLPSALGSLKVEDFQVLKWRFNNRDIAETLNGKKDLNIHAHFKGRLQLSPDFNLTVRELRPEDCGEYQRTGVKKDGSQIPTHEIHLWVYEPIKEVQIQSELTWLQVNHTCMARLMCRSIGDPNASFFWRKGTQTVSSMEMHFNISLEDEVSITCTAVNAVGQKSRNVIVRCSRTDWKLYLYIWLPIAVFLGIVVLIVYCCRRNKPAEAVREHETVYCSIIEPGSESKNVPMTLYETVGDLNMQPMTIYDKVNLNQSPVPPPTPLKKVL